MKRRRIWSGSAVLAIALLLALAGAPSGTAGSKHVFDATVTEDFVFRGCTFPVDPLLVDLCGTATTNLKQHGTALTTTVITGFTRLPSGCFSDRHTTTFAFGDEDSSTLVADVSGMLCPTGGPNFTFTGTYAVAGGTGEFDDASGHGSVIGGRQNGPVVSRFLGSLDD